MGIAKKIYVIVGELSGETHAADVVRSILDNDSTTKIRGCGSTLMERAGCEIAFDYRKYAFMGFWEVIKNLRSIKSYLKAVLKDIHRFEPDAIILVDYGGFNLKLATKLRGQYPIHYYIPPKIWAWNTKRALKIKKYISKVYSILPFEVPFFQQYDIDITYVGNPSVQQVTRFRKKHIIEPTQEIALFPGSRVQEIQRMLPIMLEAIQKLDVPFKISKASNVDWSIYLSIYPDKTLYETDNYNLLSRASFAFVTSGTATLETALFEVPQIVCYVANPLSYMIAKRVIRVPYISLVNLIMRKEVVPELIQKDCTPEAIATTYLKLKASHFQGIQNDYTNLYKTLGARQPSTFVAQKILEDLPTKS